MQTKKDTITFINRRGVVINQLPENNQGVITLKSKTKKDVDIDGFYEVIHSSETYHGSPDKAFIVLRKKKYPEDHSKQQIFEAYFL